MILFTVFALVILFPCGGLNYIQKQIELRKNPAKVNIQAEAQKLGDFSKIPKEYKLTRVVNMLGANAVIAEDNKNKQKMLLVDPGWLLKLTKQDVNANVIDTELKKLSSKINNQSVKLSSLEVGKKGSFKALNQNIPYVRLKVKVTGSVNKSMEGIIGVINDPDKKNKLVVSMNDIGKYQQPVAEKYFRSIKLNTPKKDAFNWQ